MIQITKQEAELLRKKMIDPPIHRTAHRWYVEESFKVLKVLGRIQRGKDVTSRW